MPRPAEPHAPREADRQSAQRRPLLEAAPRRSVHREAEQKVAVRRRGPRGGELPREVGEAALAAPSDREVLHQLGLLLVLQW